MVFGFTDFVAFLGNDLSWLVFGSNDDDTLVGDPVLPSVIVGRDGDDLITGGSGSDAILGGAGDDTITGGSGDDGINGGAGRDTVVLSGSIRDYNISGGPFDSFIVEGSDGANWISDVEFLRFDDFTLNLANVSLTGDNVPLANPIEAQVGETPEAYSSSSAGADDVIPDTGRFYWFDFNTGESGTIERDSTLSLDSLQQVANQFLSDGNGLVVEINPDDVGWSVSAAGYRQFGETVLDPSEFEVTGANGPFEVVSAENSLVFDDATTMVESISVTVRDFALKDSPAFDQIFSRDAVTADFKFTINDLEYEVSATDDIQVSSVDFQTILTPDAPRLFLTPDAIDLDGDDLVFSVDTTGTQGWVFIDDEVSFVVYSPNGQFQDLANGETATDTFTYTATDTDGLSVTETVTVTIVGADEFAFV